ncbi:hypothetical protein [Paraburkholderia fungorum]|uniref:hypothetical protein n=1 Tax=Paraburkholderia fungorum TaxID=134537 RepID=UPI003877F629
MSGRAGAALIGMSPPSAIAVDAGADAAVALDVAITGDFPADSCSACQMRATLIPPAAASAATASAMSTGFVARRIPANNPGRAERSSGAGSAGMAAAWLARSMTTGCALYWACSL